MRIGNYVRNKYGIAKVIDIENNNGIDVLVFDKPICFLVDKKTGEIKEDKLLNKLALIDDIDLSKIKHSKKLIDLIEEKDFVKIEFYSPRYEERITRIFEVDYIVDKSICFENGHCQLNILNGEWANQDKKLKPIIKSIVTKEQFESMEYKVKE